MSIIILGSVAFTERLVNFDPEDGLREACDWGRKS